jgi:dihydrofolate synthase/folylpolyglutamate synthase
LKIDTYEEAQTFLYSQLASFQKSGGKAVNPTLDNIKTICLALGNPELQYPCLHIAGTNGKGSSSHYLASVLQEAGYKVGLYTSPHLFSYTERFKINGKELDKSWILNFVNQHYELIKQVSPSFYELSVAIAFECFAQEKVEIAVIEVGLGGLWDSTNIIQPLVSLITNISFDHKDILGDTLEEIAFQKAGIIKKNTPIVISETQSKTKDVFREVALEKEAPIYFAEDFYQIKAFSKSMDTYLTVYEEGQKIIENLKAPLLGTHQQKNLKGVFKTLSILKETGWEIPLKAIIKGIENFKENVNLQGRWQIIDKAPLTVCDVAHNEGGIVEVNRLIKSTKHEQLHLILGFARDKDLSAILKLFPQDAHFYFCTFDSPRACTLDELRERVSMFSLDAVFVEDVNQAWRLAQKNAKENDLIYIGGSTFVVAEVNLIAKK